MARYRVLHDFGSHLGNHLKGECITLPEGRLPRGFEGFVEAVPEPRPPVPETKDVVPASGRAGAVPSQEAGSLPPAADTGGVPPLPSPADPPESEGPPTPASQARAGYADKQVRSAHERGRR